MKILQINCVYKKGSTGKIVYDMHSELLKDGIESIVCYGRGERVEESGVYKVSGEVYSKVNHLRTNLTGVKYGGCSISTRYLTSIIKKERPDVVHLHCINGYFVNIYHLLTWLKERRIKTVLTLHAEFMYTGGCGNSMDCNQWNSHLGCGYSKCPRLKVDIGSWVFDKTKTMWQLMSEAFEGFNENLIIVSVSPWLSQRAKSSTILSDKEHHVVFNGIDKDIFHIYSENANIQTRKELGLGDEWIVFHATAFFTDDQLHIKGGYYLIELAKCMPEITFVVAGEYKQGIKVPDNIKLLGKVKNQEYLARLYSMSDLTVLTSLKETFSMVVAESLCCGTRVVGFYAGAPEVIALEKYSKFVQCGNVSKLAASISEMLHKRFDVNHLAEESKIYTKEAMAERYIEIYREFLSR